MFKLEFFILNFGIWISPIWSEHLDSFVDFSDPKMTESEQLEIFFIWNIGHWNFESEYVKFPESHLEVFQRENPDNSSQCRAGVWGSIFTELIVFIQVLLARGSLPSTRLMPAPTTCPKPTPGEETVSTVTFSDRLAWCHARFWFNFYFYLIHFHFTVKVVSN